MPPKKRRSTAAGAAAGGPSKKRAGKQAAREEVESSPPPESVAAPEGSEVSEVKPQPENVPDEGLQVIVLGASGGPFEDRTSSFLVRSLSTNWREKSVVAIDAGSLLAGILHILETSVEGGPNPFANLPMDGIPTNIGRALHIFRNIIGSICLTHPHMDHILGLIINTQALQNTSSPKTVACLQSVIDALKQYVFNGVLWPNLTDDQGAGLITFHTLIEGGNPMLGSEDLIGYDELCEKLLIKCYKVTHGECAQTYDSTQRRWRRRSSAYPHPHQQPEPAVAEEQHTTGLNERTESSAFFIRDRISGKEIIIFGDIEPDSVSSGEWNKRIWKEAAESLARGSLQAIFIECSYDDSITDQYLYGHLCPRHLAAELKTLAGLVKHGDKPLSDLVIYITHVKMKDNVGSDETPGMEILEQVRKHCDDAKLGCRVELALRGVGYYF